jgi:hypothetical protein
MGIDARLPAILGYATIACVLLSISIAYRETFAFSRPIYDLTSPRIELAQHVRSRLLELSTCVLLAVLAVTPILLQDGLKLRQQSRITSPIGILNGQAHTYMKYNVALSAYLASSFVLSVYYLAIFHPVELAAIFARGQLLLVVLGGWVPLLTFLSIGAEKLRLPLVSGLIISLAVLSTFTDEFNDVRTINSVLGETAQAHQTRSASPTRQDYIDQAVEAWRIENECANSDLSSCPPMILIAAEGGASRAAFFTASVIGHLIDETVRNPDTHHQFRRAIFAMSGVSGGALGVATVSAALSEGLGAPPCQRSDPLWFGHNRGEDYDPTTSWRACLQLLTVGDYLTPTIAGLAFRDPIAFPLSLLSSQASIDRSVLLEQAMER